LGFRLISKAFCRPCNELAKYLMYIPDYRHRLSGWLIGSLLASTCLTVAGAPASAGSIGDTVRAAITANPDVGVVKDDRRAVDQELRQAQSGYLPSLDFRGAVGPEVTNNANTRQRGPGSTDTAQQTRFESELKLSQMIFDGYSTSSEVARQRARQDSASYRVGEASEFVAVDAVRAHLDVLRNREIVRLGEENLATHRRILNQVGDLERNGRGSIADVRQTEARVAEAQASLELARGTLQDAMATYQRVVGEPPTSLGSEPAPVGALPAGREDAARAASVSSPTVLIAASDVDVASAQLKGSRSGFYPQIDAELSAVGDRNIDGQDGSDSSASALVVLRYNLFRGGADIAREREAFHRLNESRASLMKARLKAEEDARTSWNAYETAKARTLALNARAEAQRRTRDAYASQFDIGQRSLLDLLDSENELFLARVDYVTAQYSQRFAVYRILGVEGTLLSTLDIAAPRESININRSPAGVQSPSRIDEKSRQIQAPLSEPQPLRGAPAGAPPVSEVSAPDAINATAPAAVPQEPAVVTSPTVPSGKEPRSLTPKQSSAVETPAAVTARLPQPPATATATAAPNGGSVPSYESFGSFWKAMTGDAPAAMPTAATTTVAPAAAAAPQPTVADPPPAAPASSTSDGIPSYPSFSSFWKSVTGDK
jgi:adhesin transport system outer membrane protein